MHVVPTPTAYPLPFVMEAWDNRADPARRNMVHEHGGHELLLIRDLGTVVVHAGAHIQAKPGTIFLHRHGEKHGVIGDGAPTRMLVVNYEPDARFEAAFPALGEDAKRIWHLDDAQMATYLDLFTRIQAEIDGRRQGYEQAASAWLRLLLVLIGRADAQKPDVLPIRFGHLRQLADALSTREPIEDGADEGCGRIHRRRGAPAAPGDRPLPAGIGDRLPARHGRQL